MPTKLNTQHCDCGGSEFYFAKDLNLEPVWKRGNKYCRICADCGNRYFLAKSMYERVSDKYVILMGESEPIPVFECPACDTEVTGTPDACPYCDAEYEWEPADEESVEAAPAEETQGIPDEEQPDDEEAEEAETPDEEVDVDDDAGDEDEEDDEEPDEDEEEAEADVEIDVDEEAVEATAEAEVDA